MAKAKLKTVERKTTVSREAIRKAFAEVRAEKSKGHKSASASALSQKTSNKKK